jgi:hypothetical protein
MSRATPLSIETILPRANGTAREGDVQHAGQRDVVDELAPPGQQAGSSLRRTRWPM